METLKTGSVDLDFLEKFYREKVNLEIDLSLKDKVEASAKIVAISAKGSVMVFTRNDSVSRDSLYLVCGVIGSSG